MIQFTNATTTGRNAIHVLLISDKGYLDKNISSLFKDHYGQSLFKSARTPTEAILMTRPVVMIDEPHRIKRDRKTYQNIISQIDPPMIVRFGATFPVIEKGRLKGKIDYYNENSPVYDLNAIDSFNEGLVKGVEAIYPELKNSDSSKYKVKTVTSKNLVLVKDGKEFELSVGDNLSIVLNDDNFDGDVTLEPNKLLSTGLELSKGMELVAGIFGNSYQEIMLMQLVNEHFEKEQDSFLREGWDNPNVFVIAKLRSSDSEASKLQEVGRGLRLSVDEAGHRISNEDLFVSYIVDFSEKEFASKLIFEINVDMTIPIEKGVAISEKVIDSFKIPTFNGGTTTPDFVYVRSCFCFSQKKLITIRASVFRNCLRNS